MTISELLPAAYSALADSGVPEPAREANSLIQYTLGRDRVFLISHPEYELTAGETRRVDDV